MSWIDKYNFIRHTPGGRVFPDLDCWGLVRCILAERKGIELPEFCDFSQKTMGDPASGMIAQHVFQEIPAPEDYCVICYYRHGILFMSGFSCRVIYCTLQTGMDSANSRLNHFIRSV